MLSASVVVMLSSGCDIFLHCGMTRKLSSFSGSNRLPSFWMRILVGVAFVPFAAMMLMVTALARSAGQSGIPLMLGWSCKMAS